jgi:uncharacterized protein (TIGR00369 family)
MTQPSTPTGTDPWGPTHTRSITWHDPAATVHDGAAMSGLDYLTAMRDGRLPASPIAQITGIEAVAVSPGHVVLRSVADPSFQNPMGAVHGGYICTLLDAAAASAVHTTLVAGIGYTSVEIKVNFLRAVRAGETVLAHGWVTKPGSRVAFAAADIRRPDGELIADASTTCLIRAH